MNMKEIVFVSARVHPGEVRTLPLPILVCLNILTTQFMANVEPDFIPNFSRPLLYL